MAALVWTKQQRQARNVGNHQQRGKQHDHKQERGRIDFPDDFLEAVAGNKQILE